MPKTLLFIEANTTGTGMLALQTAARLGLEPVLVTDKPERYAGLAATRARVLVCDTRSFEACVQAITAAYLSEAICGITTTSEFYLELTAQLAERYGVVGNPLAAMRTCRNKALTRQALDSAGVQQPRFAIVAKEEDLGAALTSIGLPCVIKPVDDTGSNLVRLCTTPACAAEHTRQILAIETNVRGQPTSRMALVEEFLDAPEYSVEMFSWNGRATCIGITEKHLIGAPYFVEHRHFFPASLPAAISDDMAATVSQALQVAGIHFGPTHTEVKLTPRGCAIVEINARLAGGMIPELIRHATGIDLLEQQIRTATGHAPELHGIAKRCAGIQFVVAPHGGTLATIDGVEAASLLTGVEQITITAQPGAAVSAPRSAYDRLGFVIATGASYHAAEQHLNQAADGLRLVFA